MAGQVDPTKRGGRTLQRILPRMQRRALVLSGVLLLPTRRLVLDSMVMLGILQQAQPADGGSGQGSL